MSDDPLSTETTRAIEKMCKRLGKAGSDTVDRPALAARLVHEVRSYLSGDQRPTEGDALLLVERHLGDPAMLSALLGEAHHRPVDASLGRRLLAVAAVTAALATVARVFTALVSRTLTHALPGHLPWFAYIAGDFGTAVLYASALAAVLRRLRAAERAGRPIWYQRMGLGRLALLAALLSAGPLLASGLAQRPSMAALVQAGRLPTDMKLAFAVMPALAALAVPWMWVWWCDGGPSIGARRRFNVTLVAALTWAAITAGSMPLQIQWQHVYYGFPPGGGRAAHEAWRLRWMPELFATATFASVSACMVAAAVLAQLTYLGWRRWARPPSPAIPV